MRNTEAKFITHVTLYNHSTLGCSSYLEFVTWLLNIKWLSNNMMTLSEDPWQLKLVPKSPWLAFHLIILSLAHPPLQSPPPIKFSDAETRTETVTIIERNNGSFARLLCPIQWKMSNGLLPNRDRQQIKIIPWPHQFYPLLLIPRQSEPLVNGKYYEWTDRSIDGRTCQPEQTRWLSSAAGSVPCLWPRHKSA